MNINPKFDAYIEKARPFAQPVLNFIRETVHATCPAIEETIKWSFPHFEYKGKILCSMAAFKEHCALNFWLAGQMSTLRQIVQKDGMGEFGKIKTLKDLP